MEYPSTQTTLSNGSVCVIRRPEDADAEGLLRHQKQTSGETPYLVVGPEEIDWTAEEQRGRIARWNASPRRLRLLAEVDGALAGVALVYDSGPQRRLRHRCTVDITLARRFWRLGIGTALLTELLAAARTAGYEQAELETVSSNAAAVALYRKLGFEAAGTIPRAIKYQDGSYADFLLMVKAL